MDNIIDTIITGAGFCVLMATIAWLLAHVFAIIWLILGDFILIIMSVIVGIMSVIAGIVIIGIVIIICLSIANKRSK